MLIHQPTKYIYLLIRLPTPPAKAKHLQFVSGVNFITYWTASAIWDYVLFLLPCGLCVMCLAVSIATDSYIWYSILDGMVCFAFVLSSALSKGKLI